MSDYDDIRNLTHEAVVSLRAKRVRQISKWTTWVTDKGRPPIDDEIEEILAEHYSPDFIGATGSVLALMESVGWKLDKKRRGLKYDRYGTHFIMSHPAGVLYVRERRDYFRDKRGVTQVTMRRRQRDDL